MSQPRQDTPPPSHASQDVSPHHFLLEWFPPSSHTSSPPDFFLEWYKLHRQHELELNKATLAYELELAKLFVLLNGGAAGAFLTLTGAVWKDGPRPVFAWIACAITFWLIGLFMAAVATHQAYRTQSEYTKAYRFRRYGEELRRVDPLSGLEPKHLGIPEHKGDLRIKDNSVWRRIVTGFTSGFRAGNREDDKAKNTRDDLAKAASDSPTNDDKAKTTRDDLAKAASDARTRAARWADSVSFFQFLAVLLFVAGGLSALVAFYEPLTSPPLIPKTAP
jgi:hypothetical protein